jgi:hypothetical protein
MLEQLAGVLYRESELQNGDAGEGMGEPAGPAIVLVVAQHRLTDAESFRELASRPASKGADRIDAAEH